MLLLEQILSVKSKPQLEGLCQLAKQTGSHENCLPLKTWRKKWIRIYTPFNILKFTHVTFISLVDVKKYIYRMRGNKTIHFDLLYAI